MPSLSSCWPLRTVRVLMAVAIMLTPSLGVPLLAAQTGTIEGAVKNAVTGEVIVGAEVTIGGTNMGTRTGTGGRFTLVNVPAGLREIRVLAIGFKVATVPVTVTAVMMTINYRRLPALAQVAAGFGANLRVNVYQPARTDRFTLAYEQLWEAFRGLAAATRLVATTEPVLAGVLGLHDFSGPGCGRSTIRITPEGRVMPCTYWPGSRLTIADLERVGEDIIEADEFVAARRPPPACAGCPCRGGCAGRRALTGRPDAPDPYCPFARGEQIVLDWERAGSRDLPKVGSA